MNEDSELLRRFADEGSQEAFAELVRRTVNFVYAAALRQTGGDAHLAQDVTQAVYLALACRAAALKRHPVLTGWLHTTTRFLAIRTVRTQARWRRREQEANTMKTLLHETEPAWESLRPVIDEALHELGETDRTALLLRYFEGRSLAEVGSAIGLNENSARMRVERALEKLRSRLARRGVTSTVAAIGLVLANQPAVAAPPGFAAVVTGPALAGAAAGGSGWWALAGLMGATKLTLVVIGAAAVLGTGAYLGGRYQGAAKEAERRVEPLAPSVSPATPAGITPVTGRNLPTAASQPAGQRLNEFVDDVAQLRARREASVVAIAGGAGTVGALGSTAPAAAGALRVSTDLGSHKLPSADLPFVDSERKLDPAFSERFSLSASERAALQQAVDRALDRLMALERANAVVTHAGADQVVVRVHPFAEAGGKVYDELMKSFADTLGPGRTATFLGNEASQVARALGQFGAAPRTVTFSFDPNAPEARRYSVSEQHELPGEAASSSGNSFASLRETLDWAGTVGRLVPADFGR